MLAKNNTKYFIGIIIITICCLNINIIVNKDNNVKSSLSMITQKAFADAEDIHYKYWNYCHSCVPAPGQPGQKIDCILNWDQGDWYCYATPCYYGFC